MTETDKLDDLAAAYLAEVESRLTGVSTFAGAELLADLRDHIAQSGATSEAELRTVLDRLGTPETVAAAAHAESTTPPGPPAQPAPPGPPLLAAPAHSAASGHPAAPALPAPPGRGAAPAVVVTLIVVGVLLVLCFLAFVMFFAGGSTQPAPA